MSFKYVTVEEAVDASGLRMVVVGNVPSPWGEAAKGIFHIKNIDWAAVRLDYESDALKKWAGQRSGPVAVYDAERPRDGWAEILLLAERLRPEPHLLPKDAALRALVLGLSHELLGEEGLAWARRLQLVHAGLNGNGGFPERVAKYIGKKYGYRPDAGAAAGARVADLLSLLVSRLKAQRESKSPYYVGDSVSAVDVYSATVSAMFGPLSPEHCEMNPNTRAAFETTDEQTQAALDPILFEHRDMMYQQHLELPLAL